MVAKASSFIGMTFPIAGLGRACWIVKLRGRKRRHLQRPRGSVPKLARRMISPGATLVSAAILLFA